MERGVIVIRVVIAALAVSAATITAAGGPQQQQPPVPPVNPPSTTAPPVQEQTLPVVAPVPPTPPPPAITAPLDPETYRRRRAQIKIMEGVLQGAVRSAAQDMASRLQSQDTGPFLLSGSLGATGFILEGYGVFFHVEIPGVQPSVVSLASLQSLRDKAIPRGLQPENAATGNTGRPLVSNADADYVQLVTRTLMDAIVEHGRPLDLQPNEWFTVAAGDGDEPMMPAVLLERATMIMRVRGSDIADYAAGRATLEEVRKRIEIRKF
jgi:hypothetical protein